MDDCTGFYLCKRRLLLALDEGAGNQSPWLIMDVGPGDFALGWRLRSRPVDVCGEYMGNGAKV